MSVCMCVCMCLYVCTHIVFTYAWFPDAGLPIKECSSWCVQHCQLFHSSSVRCRWKNNLLFIETDGTLTASCKCKADNHQHRCSLAQSGPSTGRLAHTIYPPHRRLWRATGLQSLSLQTAHSPGSRLALLHAWVTVSVPSLPSLPQGSTFVRLWDDKQREYLR